MGRNLMGNCKYCYYYTVTNKKEKVGRCHRFPEALVKGFDDYCGEHVDSTRMVARKVEEWMK